MAKWAGLLVGRKKSKNYPEAKLELISCLYYILPQFVTSWRLSVPCFLLCRVLGLGAVSSFEMLLLSADQKEKKKARAGQILCLRCCQQ